LKGFEIYSSEILILINKKTNTNINNNILRDENKECPGNSSKDILKITRKLREEIILNKVLKIK
jgi:hypothetical protein